MDLGPEEIFLKFWEVSRNCALKRFTQFFVQPAANGLSIYYFFYFFPIFILIFTLRRQIKRVYRFWKIVEWLYIFLNLNPIKMIRLNHENQEIVYFLLLIIFTSRNIYLSRDAHNTVLAWLTYQNSFEKTITRI